MKINLSENIRAKLKWQLADLSLIIISFLLALLVGAVFLALLDCSPIEAYKIIFSKAFTSFGQVLRRATPYMLTGLAVAVPLKSGMLNMGGEGQVAAGAFVAAVIGSSIVLPTGVHAIACILAAALIGAILAGVSAYLKVKFGAGEVVTTIMLNYIVMYVLQYLSMYTFRGSANSAQTAPILETAKIPRVFHGAQWSYGLFIAIAICFLVAFFLERTKSGLEMKCAGLSPLTAKYQGININTMALVGMIMGGALAGIGGSLEVLGGRYLYLDTYFANYGYDGVAICYMAKNNPIGIILTSLIVSVLKVGAVSLDRSTNVSVYFIIALQGIIITLLVSPFLIRHMITTISSITKKQKAVGE